MSIPIERHNDEIKKNLLVWKTKPSLRFAYGKLYSTMISYINKNIPGKVVEIGSGIGNFKAAYPDSIATDIFPNDGVDQIESAYKLSFAPNSLSHLVLFDVLHHLKYPGSALVEFNRVLGKGGRIIICDPYTSLLGLIVYGIFHHEPLGLFKKIDWTYGKGTDPDKEYYAAQGNSLRIFSGGSEFRKAIEKDWNIVAIKKYSALSYALSGGFRKQHFYPESALPILLAIEKLLDPFPSIFATRIIIVIEKK